MKMKTETKDKTSCLMITDGSACYTDREVEPGSFLITRGTHRMKILSGESGVYAFLILSVRLL